MLESVPEEARSQGVKLLELGDCFLPVERALRVQWAIESDTFGFTIIVKDQPLTRRGILSTISSVYDPLGIAAPFLLVGKQILQDLCRTKLSWDEEVSEEFRVRWENWKSQLPALERFSMERCFKPLVQSCRDRSITSPMLPRWVTVKCHTSESRMRKVTSIVHFLWEKLT